MCDTPEGKILDSPKMFSNICCNLENKFLDGRDSLRSNEQMCVFGRVRPLLPEEKAKGYKECVAAVDEQTVRVVVPVTSAKYKSSRQTEEIIEDYQFTAAFGPETGQFVFFQETMLNVMSNFVEGSNSLVFSYGITGSGKTYTLQGNSENPGIIPLSLKLYFAVTEKQMMKDIMLKPHMYSDVIKLSESEKQKEVDSRDNLLCSYDDECEAVPGSFRNNNNKSFAMMLCNLFSDDFEAEERQTTLCAEDMASAQAAALLKEEIKKCADNQPGSCSIWVSFIEIYNEVIFDLLQPVTNQRSKLNLGEDKNGNVYVKGATEVCVFNSEEAIKILNIGRKHLSIASTKMNYQSSRSHCIYTIRVVRIPDINNISLARVNRLSFCDLAGSERTSKTQTTGVRLKEASAINTSLLVLGRCLEHLRLNQTGRDKRLIPFRESKLTRIFSGFFLGQGRASMIANASPSDYTFDETLHVLKFSAIAKKILVNDTFLSNASSTIQSICNQWDMYKTNLSTCNESIESVDFDSSLIQEKDELIEKLLSLASNFAQKEKEMNQREMDIRREVCQEYAEVREELLEMQKLRYEEEIDILKEAYEKRIASIEKRYENIIKGYKDQLSESITDESMVDDQSLNASQSFEIFNDSLKSSAKSDSSQLKKELEEKAAELDSIKKELENKQSELSNLKRLHEELTLKMIDIEAEREKLQNLLTSEVQNSSQLSKNQEEKAAELNSVKEELENKQSELNMLKHLNEELTNKLVDTDSVKEELENKQSELNTLKHLNEELTNKMVDNDSVKEKLENKQSELNTLKHLHDELTNKMVDTESAREKLQNLLTSSTESASQLKKELEEKTAELDFVKEDLGNKQSELIKLKRLHEELTLKITDIESNREKLQSLLASGTQDSSQIKKELEEKSAELDSVKKELENKQSKLNDLKHVHEELNVKINDVESNRENLQNLLTSATQKNEVLESNIVSLQKEIEELKSLRASDEEKLKSFKRDTEEFAAAKQELESSLDALVQKETIKYTDKINSLEEQIVALKATKSSNEKDFKILQGKLSQSQVENGKSEKIIHDQCETISTLENESEMLRKEIEELEKKLAEWKESKEACEKMLETEKNKHKKEISEARSTINEFSNVQILYKSDLEKKNEKIAALEEELKIANKNYDTLQKELKLRETVAMESEKEIDQLKQKIEKLTKEMQESVSSTREMEKNISILKDELKLSNDNSLQLSSKLKEMEDINKKYEQDLQAWKQDKLCVDSEKKELVEKVNVLSDNIKSLKKDVHEKTSKILELENLNKKYQMDREKLQKDESCLDIQTKELEEKLISATNNMKLMKQDIQEKSSKILELENKINVYKVEVENLKNEHESLESENVELKSEVNSFKGKVKEVEEKLTNMINECKSLESEKLELKSQVNSFKEKVRDLEEKHASAVQRLSIAQKVNPKEIDNCKQEIKNLKESLQSAEKAKNDLHVAISEKDKKMADIEKELCSVKDQLKTAKMNLDEKDAELKELKKDLAMPNVQLQEKVAEIEAVKENLKKKESDLLTIRKECEKIRHDHDLLIIEKKNLQNNIDLDKQNFAKVTRELEENKSELASVMKELRKNESNISVLKDKNEKLNVKIKEIESAKKNLEKKISETENISKEKLKECKASCEEKILMEKEQHTVEIEETMKLKREVEEENKKLKKENIEFKENIESLEKELKSFEQKNQPEKNNKETLSRVNSKTLNTKVPAKVNSSKGVKKIETKETGAKPKAASKTETKETKQLPKTPSSRSLRQKETKLLDLTMSSTDDVDEELGSTEPDASKRARKRVSDEDFDPDKDRASKKMKSVQESSKIPVQRTSRRKLTNDQTENLSPVQKFANSISTRFKAVAENVSSKISSPRLTRGRKKLFNPDSEASTKAERVRRGKK